MVYALIHYYINSVRRVRDMVQPSAFAVETGNHMERKTNKGVEIFVFDTM
jgi:hypothetical protein